MKIETNAELLSFIMLSNSNEWTDGEVLDVVIDFLTNGFVIVEEYND